MKYLPHIVGALLGLLFILSGMVVLLKMAPMPELPAGSPAALFMGALAPTGYLTFIKVLEVIGGLLVMVPRTRNFGLLILGPIVVNILAYHTFIAPEGLFSAPVMLVAFGSAYLLWAGRKQFGALRG